MLRRLLRKVGAGLGLRRKPPVPPPPAAPAPASASGAVPVPERPSSRHPGAGAARRADPRPARAATPPAAPWVPGAPPPPVPGKTRFTDLDLPLEIQHAVADLRYQYCTPIQAAILPVLLSGRDAAGQSQTGTGKTAAFLVALFTRFLRQPRAGSVPPGVPRALVLAPTRELAMQIRKEADALAVHSGIVTVAVFGGMDYEKQRRALAAGRVDLLVATPGRLLDFMGSGTVHVDRAEVLVIDEADRMMDMGFIPDVTRIVRKLPPRGQRRTWLFSATLSPEVMTLASRWMDNPQRVEIQPEKIAVDTIDQKVYIVSAPQKIALLVHLLTRPEARRVIVFVNRRDSAERLVERLRRHGLNVALLSGAVSQEKRIRTLEAFRSGQVPIVVATDVAGRGLHIEDVTHVINFNLPEDPEDYVHRIGRTGRVGASGVSVAFACEDESFLLPDIEKFMGRPLVYEQPPDEWLDVPPPRPRTPEEEAAQRESRRAAPRSGGGFRRSGGGRGGGSFRGSRRPSGRPRAR
jgi:ATP-dependent RNA helicase RhlB